MISPVKPSYLKPYLSAARRHRGSFGSLLWESKKAQGIRFEALARLCEFEGHSILDVGCGRADLLDFLLNRGIRPRHYIGLEAVQALADTARRKRRANCEIVEADFVADPRRLFAGADVIVFSGSLTTLNSRSFYTLIRKAHQAAAREVAFNFLASPLLAGAEYLHWHRPKVVLKFAELLGSEVAVLDDYLDGDCTVRVKKV